MFRSGDKEFYRQLINLYVDKVVVYYDHIEFYLNTLPADILRGELDRSLGIGEDETLVSYMMKYDPEIVEAIACIVIGLLEYFCAYKFAKYLWYYK